MTHYDRCSLVVSPQSWVASKQTRRLRPTKSDGCRESAGTVPQFFRTVYQGVFPWCFGHSLICPQSARGAAWAKLECPKMTTPPKLVGHREAAARLGISPATLRGWRCKGHGPKFLKFGPSRASGVAYYIEDIDAWLAERRFGSTTEHSEAVRAAGLEAGRYRTIPNLPITPPWLQSQPAQPGA